MSTWVTEEIIEQCAQQYDLFTSSASEMNQVMYFICPARSSFHNHAHYWLATAVNLTIFTPPNATASQQSLKIGTTVFFSNCTSHCHYSHNLGWLLASHWLHTTVSMQLKATHKTHAAYVTHATIFIWGSVPIFPGFIASRAELKSKTRSSSLLCSSSFCKYFTFSFFAIQFFLMPDLFFIPFLLPLAKMAKR